MLRGNLDSSSIVPRRTNQELPPSFMEHMKIQLYFHTIWNTGKKSERKNEKNQALGKVDFGSNKLFPIYRYVFLSFLVDFSHPNDVEEWKSNVTNSIEFIYTEKLIDDFH